MKYRTQLRKLIRPFGYSLLLVLGLSVAFDQLHITNDRNFFTVVFIISFILLIEIYTSWTFYKINHPQIQIEIEDKYDKAVHWAHHLVLPLLAYYGGALFIYFNRTPNTRWFLYAVNLFIFTLLFYNLRSYFEKNKSQEKLSHYIYDIIKLYIFFVVNSVLFSSVETDIKYLVIPFTNILLTSIFIVLSTSRKQLTTNENVLLVIMLSCILGVISVVTLLLEGLGSLEFAFIHLIMFYIASALFHHFLDKTLKFSILMEYIAILLLAISIFLTLS